MTQALERDAQRLQASQRELVERISNYMREDGVIQPFQGVHLARVSTPLEKLYSVMEPSLCVVAQGSKEVLLGDKRYVYDPFHYLIATLELPRVSQVLEASPERPYFSFRLVLDSQVISSVMVEAGYSEAVRTKRDLQAVDVSPLDADLLDAVVRLVRLLDTPNERHMLMPMITREISYRLLKGAQGTRLRHMIGLGGYSRQIAKAVQRIRQDFDKPLRIEQLAGELGMSVSGFHQHFKAVTALSPLQFQKQLRLQEARRLLLGEDFDANTVAYQVGYNDASHFNREYKSLFGIPPMRDVHRLREEAVELSE